MGTISVGQAYLFQAQEDLRAAKMVGSDMVFKMTRRKQYGNIKYLCGFRLSQ